jgi:hypothetical protein
VFLLRGARLLGARVRRIEHFPGLALPGLAAGASGHHRCLLVEWADELDSWRVLQTARASRQPSAGTDNLSPPRLAGTKVLPLKADTAIPHGCDDRIHSFGSIGDSAGRFAVLKGEQHAV